MPGGLTAINPAAIAVVLLLTGCGGNEPTDEERVDAALLQLADFPADAGWAVQPETTDPEQARFDAAIEECEAENDPTLDSRTANRDSETFTRGQDVLAVSNAAVVADEQVRDDLFEALDAMLGCFATALETELLAQAPDEFTVRVADPQPLAISTAADRSEGRAVQLSIQAETIFIDLVAIEQGPTLLYGAFMHQGDLTQDDEAQILAPAVQRLQEL